MGGAPRGHKSAAGEFWPYRAQRREYRAGNLVSGADFNFSKYESKTSLIGLGPFNGGGRWKNISLRGWQWIRFAGHLRELKNASWGEGLPTAKD